MENLASVAGKCNFADAADFKLLRALASDGFSFPLCKFPA